LTANTWYGETIYLSLVWLKCIHSIDIIMAVTRLKRKSRVNRTVANNRIAEIRRLNENQISEKLTSKSLYEFNK
jgi:hypothetical protein